MMYEEYFVIDVSMFRIIFLFFVNLVWALTLHVTKPNIHVE